MPATISLRLDTFSFAQLKVLRRIWPGVIPGRQISIVADARELTSSVPLQGPFQNFALPGTCSPSAVARLSDLAHHWQYLSPGQRSELLADARAVSAQ